MSLRGFERTDIQQKGNRIMFDSIYSASVMASEFFIMMAASLITGFVYSWIMSFRIRAKKRFFMVTAIIPFIVAAVITFVNGNIGAEVALGKQWTVSADWM